MLSSIDLDYLRLVQNLSLKNLGLTGDNPSVACVIVDFTKDDRGKILSYGLTDYNGRPHAEAVALENLNKKYISNNLTAYISLEPCFKGDSKSCSKLLNSYGIKRVVIDSLDPNRIIYNKGLSFLVNQKHEVLINNKSSNFKNINKIFYANKFYNRPFITLKIAVSKNSYSKNPLSKNITEKTTQEYMHHLRLKHDAIGVGYNTLIEDKPKLTCRLQGVNKKLKKIIFTNSIKKIKRKDLIFIKVDNSKDFGTNLNKILFNLKINSLLIEGGAKTFKFFLKNKIFDEIYLSISDQNIKNKNPKYKVGINLFKDLKKISHNFYGKDQIIVYKNTNV